MKTRPLEAGIKHRLQKFPFNATFCFIGRPDSSTANKAQVFLFFPKLECACRLMMKSKMNFIQMVDPATADQVS